MSSFTDDFVAELAIAKQWVDITDDVLGDPGVTITRGAADESSDPEPARCELKLKNAAAAKYSPRNPTGVYYGQIGRNQPFRFARRVARDQAGSGVASHVIGAASSSRMTYQAGQLYRDADCAVTVAGPPTTITGGTVQWAVTVGGTSTTSFYYVILRIATSGVLSMLILDAADNTVYGTTTVTGFTWTGAPIRIRAQVDGNTIRGKAWLASGAEPYAWVVEGDTTTSLAPSVIPKGWAGVRSSVNAGNTNGTVTFTYDNWEVRSNRFIGEVSTWPNSWDLNGEDIRTSIVASDPTRRLAQGEAPQQSTYRRGNEKGIFPAHLAYWPVEDKAGATQIASGMGGSPMVITGEGMPQFGSNTEDFVCSAGLGQPKGSAWFGRVPVAAGTGQLQAIFLVSVPSTGENDTGTFLQLQCTGTVGFVDLFYRTGGNLQMKMYNQARQLVYTSGSVGFGLDGNPSQVSLELTQNGANIDWAIATLQPGQTVGTVTTGTAAAFTFGSCYSVAAPPYRSSILNSAMGHIAVRNSITSIYTLANQLKAWAGETATPRIKRLCGENGVPVAVIADTDGVSAAMGAQKVDGLLSLIQDAVDADMGTLIDSRSKLQLVYRQRNAFYNQSPTLSLTYQQLYLPFEPSEDDRFLRNAVTVQRVDGTSFEAIKTSGPLAVTDPTSTTGVGRYATQKQLNLAADDQVQDAAYWLLNLGTVNEPRYPEVKAMVAPQPPSAQLALDALSVDVGHRIAITSVPGGLGYDDISQIARGYTEFCDGVAHWIKFNVSPETPYEVMQLDGGDASRVDLDDNYLAQAATSTATTLIVGSTGGVGWSTDPADLPIPLRLGGETVSVTAVGTENLSNPTFESSVLPWASFGATSFTQSATQKHSGSFAGRIVPDGTTPNGGVNSEFLPVVAGMPVTVSTWVWFTSAVSGNFCAGITWLDASNASLGVSTAFVSVSAATWTNVKNTFTAPAGAVKCTVTAFLQGTPPSSQVWYIDDCSLTGPQRLTVTRSVNGVVKAQSVGTQVFLARPALAAL